MVNPTRVLQLPLDKMSTSTLPEESWQPVRSPGINRMHLLWVWLLLISPGRSEALTGPEEVTGTQGSSITVQCHYEEKYVDNNKYWCEGRTRLCTVVVSTQSSPGHRHDRFSIRDNPATRSFMVTMQRLREEDAGIYQCGIRTPGFDPLFHVRVTVLQASITMNPTSISKTTTTTGVYHSSSTWQFIASSSEENILWYLLPTVGVLLVLLLLTAILLVRSQRRKKQAIRETVNNNSQLPDMFPDTIPVYAEVMKDGGSQKSGIQNIAIDEDVLEYGYEEIQILPKIPDSVPVYAVVQKPGASQMHGVQNNAENEDCYEDRQEMPKIPHTIPIYAVVKKKTGTTRRLELENDAMDADRQEKDYEEIQTSPSIGPVKSFH